MHLLILHQAWVFGGAERTTSNLLSALDRQVVTRITVAAPGALQAFLPPAYDAFVDTAGQIRHGWFTTLADLARDQEAARALIEEIRPDLALGMMHYSAALVAAAGRHTHFGLRTIAGYRGPIFEYIRRYEVAPQRQAFLCDAIAEASRSVDRIVVPSAGTDADSAVHFGARSDKTVVIPNGIDAAAVARAAEASVPELAELSPRWPLLCVAARLSVEKDLLILVDALSILHARQPCRLVVVGDGPQRPELVARAAALGVADRILFIPHRENVYPYMRGADVYVHTCQFEGFGYSMLEAMACGTPVVATDCPTGPREVLHDGRDGVLVTPPGDAAALAAAVGDLLADEPRRQHLRERGLRRAAELSIERMALGYQRLFQSVLDADATERPVGA